MVYFKYKKYLPSEERLYGALLSSIPLQNSVGYLFYNHTLLYRNAILTEWGVYMASFTDLIAQCISAQRDTLLAGLSANPNGYREQELVTSGQAHWHPFVSQNDERRNQPSLRIGAVDGSRAIRSLNVGADWIIAQALLIGPDGWRDAEGDTRILRGDI